jgi:hypothetical protein
LQKDSSIVRRFVRLKIGTINGYTYRSTAAGMGGKYMVGVSADVREAAGVARIDQVERGGTWKSSWTPRRVK